jgi:hypothetical protein
MRDAGMAGLCRRQQQPDADPAQHGGADPDRARPRCRERPRLCATRRGRNFSRTAFQRRHADKTEAQLVAEQTAGIDARFFCGIPDVSELPGAYKDAASMRRQIDAFGLAEIVDLIEPLGSIMAGDWQRPFRGRPKRSAAHA